MKRIAVLCAARNSVYKDIQDVDVYDIERDCRTFPGGMPVVAHPPCRAWSAYCAHQAKPLPGEKELGPFCVEKVKENGGILEHPAHSRLWEHCELPKPGWESRGDSWSMAVSQAWWGDTQTKETWLFIVGIYPDELEIPFRLHHPAGDRRRWQLMSKNQRAATSQSMAIWLVETARKAFTEIPT